jgi:hypothetical protein
MPATLTMFLPYHGSGPVPQQALQIDVIHTGPTQVWLENGEILLPRNDYEFQKKAVDEVLETWAAGRQRSR